MIAPLIAFAAPACRAPRRGICPDCDGLGEHLALSWSHDLVIVSCRDCCGSGTYQPPRGRSGGDLSARSVAGEVRWAACSKS